MTENVTDALIRKVLAEARHIAVVGASANPARPSYRVASLLQAKGHRIVPVNPGLAGQTLLGAPVYASLSDIPFDVDMIDIFRNAEAVPAIVDEALARFPALKAIWMQLDIIVPEAAAKARARGVDVIMDRCPAIEYARLGL